MNAHRVETVITQGGTLTLTDLPFQSGETVEVIILSESSKQPEQMPYALRGNSIAYRDPTASVAENDWERQLREMAEDPSIQKELRDIDCEFSVTEADGLDKA